MKIERFEMERFQSVWENRVSFNLSESGVHPMSLDELVGPADTDALFRQRLGYVQTNGTPALRDAIAALHPGATAQNVVVCTGTAEANYVAIWHLVEPGDEVVLMLPNYMQIWGIVRASGATVVPWRLVESRAWAPDPDALATLVTPRTRLIAVCNPNNPTGAILDEATMRAVVAAAERHGAWILSDEVYRGAERNARETASFWRMSDRVLVTGGLSKAYGLPGLRIGWVVGPAAIVEALWGRKDYLTIAPAALSDALARVALRPDVRPRILDRTRRIINENLPVLEAWMRAQGTSFHLVAPLAGAIAFARYAWSVNSTALVERCLHEQSVLVVPGDQFGMDGYLRFALGGEPGHLGAGLSRIEPVLRTLPAPVPTP